MIKITNFEVFNFINAVRGARNPLNSWHLMDSYEDQAGHFVFGENDLRLATKLCRVGSDHRKFLRQIFLTVDLYAPLYWWKEFDTYKVGTVSNSTSTMHKIHSRAFTIDDFSHDHLTAESSAFLSDVVDYLEKLRTTYLDTKDKEIWYNIIQLLPSSYNQLRTCTMNYENIYTIYWARKDHKLDEWQVFCKWAEQLPYASELLCVK